MVAFVFRRDPALVRERFRPGPGQPGWDRWLLRASGPFVVAGLAVAALDAGRWGLTDSVPGLLRVLGLAGLAAGMAVMSWAMRANTWFSKVVRIQSDRGHRVVREGPYRFVRHPGYTGWIVLWNSFHLALGSWLGLAVGLGASAVIVLRTVLEDRYLLRNLPGYDAYAREVRSRLVPGIW